MHSLDESFHFCLKRSTFYNHISGAAHSKHTGLIECFSLGVSFVQLFRLNHGAKLISYWITILCQYNGH